MEAADLGVQLCRSAARSIYPCYLMVALPVTVVAFATFEIADWLPPLLIWWAKPWLDRTILFVLSRAVFGQSTRPADVWRAQRQVWWSQLAMTWTIGRLSPWRSLTQPIYQLEGLSFRKAGARVRQIRRRNTGSALMMTQVFAICEWALALAVASLIFWLAPSGHVPEVTEIFSDDTSAIVAVLLEASYPAALLFLEPFYVAAGFAMYLNRRAELEAWDIEQEFRRAFAR
jgi:hypothetical protein